MKKQRINLDDLINGIGEGGDRSDKNSPPKAEGNARSGSGQNNRLKFQLNGNYVSRQHQVRPPAEEAPKQQEEPKDKGVKEFGWFLKLIFSVFAVGLLLAIPLGLIKVGALATRFFEAFNIKITPHSVGVLVSAEARLKTDGHGRTNVLLVGIDSRGKIGQGLKNTDTIILASYDHKTHRLFLISFPRDLWVKFPGTYYHNKINAVYAYGERLKPGHGLEYLKGLIEQLSGLKIQYYAMINFKGFKTIIDRLGGIDVYVERSFVDYMYPKGLGYMTVRFSKGWNHFNGERALQYARSRKAAGPEGSDFARARRQQKVIQAVIDKFKKTGIQDPKKVYEILKVVKDNIILSQVTPLDIKAGLSILKKGKPKMYSLVLEPKVANYSLIGRGQSHLYILVPKAGTDNWSQVHRFLQDWLNMPELINTNPSIPIYNGYDPVYYADYAKIRSRFFYLRFYPGGTVGKRTGKYVFGVKFKSEADLEYFAKASKILKYKKLEKVDSKFSNKEVVIVLGR